MSGVPNLNPSRLLASCFTTEVRLSQNPFESPETDSTPNAAARFSLTVRCVGSFFACLTLGIFTSQLLAFLVVRNEWPDAYVLLGAFGVLLGLLGGYLASLLCAGRIPSYFILIGFGVLILMLLSVQSPSYSAISRLTNRCHRVDSNARLTCIWLRQSLIHSVRSHNIVLTLRQFVDTYDVVLAQHFFYHEFEPNVGSIGSGWCV